VKTFAIIEGTNVINTIVADSLETVETVLKTGQICVEYFIPRLEDSYINESFVRTSVENFKKVSWGMQ
jgi:hypothetical protein